MWSTLKTRAKLWQAIERGRQQALPPRSDSHRKEIGSSATCPNKGTDTVWQEPLTELPCLKREEGVGMRGQSPVQVETQRPLHQWTRSRIRRGKVGAHLAPVVTQRLERERAAPRPPLPRARFPRPGDRL